MSEREKIYIVLIGCLVVMWLLWGGIQLSDKRDSELLGECMKTHQPVECRQMVYGFAAPAAGCAR